MRRHDDLDPERLRADLRRFAELIRRLDDEDRLLAATPRLLKVLGDLRAKLFAHEVRFTGRLRPRREPPQGGLADGQRVVEDAIRRRRQAEEEWRRLREPSDEAE